MTTYALSSTVLPVVRRAGVPVVQTLHKALQATLADAAVTQGLDSNNLLVAKPASLQESAKIYADEATQYRAIAKSINLQPQ